MQKMKPAHHPSQSYMRYRDSAEPQLDANNVRPYGRFGAGTFTAHPVGLVIALGLIILVLVSIPGAPVFVAGSIGVGAVIGLLLWLRNRNRGF